MKTLMLSTLLATCIVHAENEVELLKLKPTNGIDRAALYVWKPPGKVDAVMVFCPGHNGSGEGFAKSEEWQKFATENCVGLCGLSFASEMSLTKQGKGYSYAERGSGMLLLEGLERKFRRKELPLFLYGYSAGARFTTSFLAWKPDRVAAWCASGVGTWPSLPQGRQRIAPGIVACGEFDAGCYWSSLQYFQKGRQKDFPWLWISLKDLGHDQSPALDQFVVRYFALRLKSNEGLSAPTQAVELLDIATKRHLDSATAKISRIFSASLPANDALIKHWALIHYP